jgi:hypothetical protein
MSPAKKKPSKRLTMNANGVDLVREARKMLTKLLLAIEDAREEAVGDARTGEEFDPLLPLVRDARRYLRCALRNETTRATAIAPTMPRPPATTHGAN